MWSTENKMSSLVVPVALILAQCSLVASNEFHVIVSSIDSCPSAESSCITLNELAANTTTYLGNHSTVTVMFQPGNHYLTANSDLTISSKESVSFLSEKTAPVTSVYIHCSTTSLTTFIRIAHLYISGLQFKKCKNHHFNHIKRLILENCMFSNHTSTALHVANTNASIIESLFLFNSGGTCLRQFDPSLNNSLCVKVGGAIVTTSARVVIHNTSFQGNSAEIGGALFGNFCSNIVVHNCSFTHNTAVMSNVYLNNTGFGGVFGLMESSILIQQSTLAENKAGNEGGVVFALWNKNDQGSTMCTWISIEESLLDANDTTNSGAAQATQTSTIVINSSAFVNNSVLLGGVVETVKNTLRVSKSTFVNNTARHSGGVIHATSMTALFLETNSSFLHNRALRNGGVIYANGTDVNIDKCRFVSNTAADSGMCMKEQPKSRRVIVKATMCNVPPLLALPNYFLVGKGSG